jgi:GT2 family glycosyltransferase
MSATEDIRVQDAPAAPDGYLDFYGHASAAGGWLFAGWSRLRWPEGLRSGAVTAVFERGRVFAEALCCWHDRPDLQGRGHGVIAFLRAAARPLGELLGLEVALPEGGRLRLHAVRPLVHLREADLLGRARPLLLRAEHGTARTRLAGLLSRKPFLGTDTLNDLSSPVHLEVDETILSPPDGLLLMGWFLDPTEQVAEIRVRRGGAASPPLATRWLRTRRPDVQEAFSKLGLPDDRCGFLAYAPSCLGEIGPLYAEVELKNGEVGYKRLPAPVRSGTSAIRRTLEGIELPTDAIDTAFDRILGPALTPINAARLARSRPQSVLAFGQVAEQPVCTVIIPLYGRMDFLLHQLAHFSAEPSFARHELLFVLDDPPRKRELLDLAHSAYRRFGLPFRIVALEENLGFGPANNEGLKHARGEFVCYLNSDMIPDEPRWLELMLEGLRADPTIGVMGAKLLFEDGTVQHHGLTFERLPQLANWPFPMHPGKGRLDPGTPKQPVERVSAVTGACMVLRRGLAEELGGFDEAYVIGDFEDSDLCLRIGAKGLDCAVHHRARLFHLERQSQVTPDRMWRFHVTLLNAWTHTRRWFPATNSKKESNA